MTSTKEVRGSTNVHSPTSKKESISKKDALNALKLILKTLKENYQVNQQEIIEAYNDVGEDTIPISIFASELNPTEALVKYLKENKNLSYHEIGEIINRDERGIWGTYSRAHDRMKTALNVDSKYFVPLEIFKDRSKSVLEAVVYYLRETQGLKNKKISEILNTNVTTIAAVYSRAHRKK